MTGKIIIDGVDVVECDAYKDKHCKDKTSIIFCDTNLCSNYPYCYYKQLKRLEQENKELKEENQRLFNESIELRNKNIEYKSALEEIREYLNTLSSVDSDFPNTETYLRIQGKISEVLNDI